MTGPPELGGFSDIDRTGAAGEYAGYLDDVRGLEAVAEWKQRSFAALDPRPGAVLVDVGCGTGEDARALARLVAPGGRAIGIDASDAMVAEARRRAAAAAAAGVEYHRADAEALGLPDGAADGARAERVLQHLDDPAAAIAEMARVVRPGGAVVAAEPDWGTLAVNAGDPAVAVLVAASAAGRVRSGLVGRSLRRRFLAAGLADVSVAARTLVVTDPRRARLLFDLNGAAAAAVSEGRLPEDRVAPWLEALDRAGREGTLLVAMTAFMAVGRVGGTPGR